MQRNGYDCGAWIIACVIAAMRGYKALSMRDTERDIASFRRYLLHVALSLPELQ
jgi:Ulp1 family protease